MIIIIKNWQIVNKDDYFKYMLDIKDWEYELSPYKKDRSNSQNRYYWKILSVIADETWNDVEDLHEKFKLKFLFVQESKVQLPYAKSTTKLTTEEFTRYLDNIKNFIASYWIILPSELN